MEQNTDSIIKVTSAINNIQTSLQKQQSDTGGRVDQLSGQLQSLNDSLDELKARLGKVTKQLEDLQATQQSLASQTSQQIAQTQAQQAQLAVPPPDVLYNNALRDYNGGNADLAKQEFGDYVKNYPNTDLAGNAYFYLPKMDFKAGNFPQTVRGYDPVFPNFPHRHTTPSPQPKKDFAL